MHLRRYFLGKRAQFVALFLFLTCTLAPAALACNKSQRRPVCTKSVVIAKAHPDAAILTSDTATTIPVIVWVSATPVCPVGTSATAAITVTFDCNPDPDTAGTISGPVTINAFNVFDVPIPVPAGPERICQVTASASVTFVDGMVIDSGTDRPTTVCITDPAPGMPTVPRLDMELISGVDNVHVVHPGDQARICYRITNNDPTEIFTGFINIGIHNASVLPVDASPTPSPPGFGVASPADPAGDHPLIMFENDLLPGQCLPFPPLPHQTLPWELPQPIVVLPGETKDVYVLARPWGLCSTGTCAESTAVLNGTFSDASTGTACSGTIIINDSLMAPPSFAWPGSGATPFMQPGPLPLNPLDPVEGIFQVQLPEIGLIGLRAIFDTVGINGQEIFPGGQFVGPSDTATNSQELRYGLCFPPDITGINNGDTQFSLEPVNPAQVQVEIVELSLEGQAPSGFSDTNPIMKGIAELDIAPFDGIPEAFFDFSLQASLAPGGGDCFTQPIPGDEVPMQILPPPGFMSGGLIPWGNAPPRAVDGLGPSTTSFFLDMRGFFRLGEGEILATCADGTADFNNDRLITRTDVRSLYPNWNEAIAAPQDRDGDGLDTVADMVDVLNQVTCEVIPAPRKLATK